MKIALIVVCLLAFSSAAYTQVGINTNLPKTDLDVNGDISIRGPLKVGSSASAGTVGDVLISYGALDSPKWAPVTTVIANGTLQYALTDIVSGESRSGVKLSANSGSSFVVTSGMSPTGWAIQDNLDVSFSVEKANSLVFFALQTSVQSTYVDTTPPSTEGTAVSPLYIDFVGGLFISSDGGTTYRLLTAREGRLIGYRYASDTFQLFFSIQSMPVGNYNVKAGFNRLDSDSAQNSNLLIIGGSDTSIVPSSNPFMTKTSMKIDIYTPIDN